MIATMKKTIFFIKALLMFLIQSCDLSYSDEEMRGEKIGDSNYYLSDINYLLKWVIQDSTGGEVIGCEVVALNNDSVFIIAKQKPYHHIRDSIYKANPKAYMVFERLYNQSQLYHYWIIDTREEEVYYIDYDIKAKIVLSSGEKGPFNYNEYWEKRRELGVPDTLRLKYIEKHFMKRLSDFVSYGTPLKPRREEILE